MPECRVELFAEWTDYDPIVVIGEIAHVTAAADNGPRPAPELDAGRKNDYDNLMLLCQNCHARIDGQTGFYTEARLKDTKQSHEAWVRASLPERGRSHTGWKALALRGDHPIDLATAAEALSPDFIIHPLRILQVPTDPDNWQTVDRIIATEVRQILALGDAFDQSVAVFPLAASAPASLSAIISPAALMFGCSIIIAMNTVGLGRACRLRARMLPWLAPTAHLSTATP